VRILAKCKFCGKPLTLEVADDFHEFGTMTLETDKGSMKLADLAACNRCADYRVERRRVFDRIKIQCMDLLTGAVKKEGLPKARETLTNLVKRYMRLLADFKEVPMPDWDEAIVDGIMEKPGNYALIMALVPRMFAQPTLV
jgi:hypothetical protein